MKVDMEQLSEKLREGMYVEDECYSFDGTDISENQKFAIAAGIPCLFWVPLVAAKDSEYGKFCANQGLTLFLLVVAVNLVLGLLGNVLYLIPVLGHLLMWILRFVCNSVILTGAVFLIRNAVTGHVCRLPFVGNYVNVFK